MIEIKIKNQFGNVNIVTDEKTTLSVKLNKHGAKVTTSNTDLS